MPADEYKSILTSLVNMGFDPAQMGILIKKTLKSPEHFYIATGLLLKAISLDDKILGPHIKIALAEIGRRIYELPDGFKVKSEAGAQFNSPADSVLLTDFAAMYFLFEFRQHRCEPIEKTVPRHRGA